MSTWTNGYIAEIGYTHGFYRELTPALQRLALLAHGYEPPPETDFTYCELGFGQGVSANLVSATNPGARFWGTDFNPEHAACAANFAKSAGLTNTHWHEDSFEAFAQRDLPQFDYISLHGIYSWVSPETRKAIGRFIAKYLKPGGVVYNSYNCMPGWSPGLALRGMLVAHADSQSAHGLPLEKKIDHAIEFVGRLAEQNAGYFQANPSLLGALEAMKGQNRRYLAHEFFNRDWHPLFFADVAGELSEAKLSFAGSLNFYDFVDTLNLPDDAQNTLRGIADPVFRETTRDFVLNQRFRKDLYVKGARRLSRSEQRERLGATRFVLVVPVSRIPLKVKVPLGELPLRQDIYEPLLQALAKGPVTLNELLQGDMGKFGFDLVLSALLVLIGAAHVAPCLPESVTGNKQNKMSAGRANDQVMHWARNRAEVTVLASPLIGGAIPVDRFNQLFLYAMKNGLRKSEDCVGFVWQVMQQNGLRVMHEGKVLEAEADNLRQLHEKLDIMCREYLPIWRTLGVV